MAKKLSEYSDIPYDANILTRCRKTIPMKQLNDKERLKNLKNAFIIDENIVKYERVLVVDDITDSAHTMAHVLEHLKAKNPASIKCCVLLDKPSRREVELVPDYCGFTIEDKFVVGYGLNYGDYYRNIPYVFAVTDQDR